MMDGILLLNKPKGMTSHDCVNRVRRLFKTKKVGHTGTLDPNVTGVLPICINNATKIIQFMELDTKSYQAVISIGTSTSTEDSEGEVIEQNLSYKKITRDEILDVLNSFLGKQKQIPPMISSVKVNGKKLYQYARENKTVERPVRDIEIFEIELLSKESIFEGNEVTFEFRVHVSKGTYIRTLAVDIGQKLGYAAHLKDMIRTQSGQFKLEDCVTFEEIEQADVQLISIYEALKDRFMITCDNQLEEKIKNGKKLKNIHQQDEIVFVNQHQEVIGIYKIDENNQELIKPIRVLKTNG